MRKLKWLAVAAAIAFVPACASTKGMEERPRTYVEVDNQALADMTVYVYRGAQRVRLGLATGLRKSTFAIPQGMVFSSTLLRFQADPIGSAAGSIARADPWWGVNSCTLMSSLWRRSSPWSW